VEQNILLPTWTTTSDGSGKRLQWIFSVMPELAALRRRSSLQLSGGQQKLVALARALMAGTRILLLDEPLDSLDLHNQQEVSGVIRRISEESGAAVLLVAHDVNPLLPYVDRVCYIAQGRMAVGKPEDIINSQTLARLYGAPVEVLRTRDGRLVVVGQPEGMPCADFHAGHPQ